MELFTPGQARPLCTCSPSTYPKPLTLCPAPGRDVLAVAHTGTGKTAAYLLPLLAAISRRSRKNNPKNKAYPSVLVVVPTRELAMQVGWLVGWLVVMPTIWPGWLAGWLDGCHVHVRAAS